MTGIFFQFHFSIPFSRSAYVLLNVNECNVSLYYGYYQFTTNHVLAETANHLIHIHLCDRYNTYTCAVELVLTVTEPIANIGLVEDVLGTAGIPPPAAAAAESKGKRKRSHKTSPATADIFQRKGERQRMATAAANARHLCGGTASWSLFVLSPPSAAAPGTSLAAASGSSVGRGLERDPSETRVFRQRRQPP